MWNIRITVWLLLTGSYLILMVCIVVMAVSSKRRSRRYLAMLKAVAIGLLLLTAMSVSLYLALLQIPCAMILWRLHRPYVRAGRDTLCVRDRSGVKEAAVTHVLGIDLEFDESDSPPILRKFVIRVEPHGSIDLSGYYCSRDFMQLLVEKFGINVDVAEKVFRSRRADLLLAILGCLMPAAINGIYAIVQAHSPGGSPGEPMMVGKV
jgi:hypothetical protein